MLTVNIVRKLKNNAKRLAQSDAFNVFDII